MWLPLMRPLLGTWPACNPSMCSDWQSNRRPFHSQPVLRLLTYTSQSLDHSFNAVVSLGRLLILYKAYISELLRKSSMPLQMLKQLKMQKSNKKNCKQISFMRERERHSRAATQSSVKESNIPCAPPSFPAFLAVSLRTGNW